VRVSLERRCVAKGNATIGNVASDSHSLTRSRALALVSLIWHAYVVVKFSIGTPVGATC